MTDYLNIVGTVVFATASFITPIKLESEQIKKSLPYIYIQNELSEYSTDAIIQITTHEELKNQHIKLHLAKISDYVPSYSSDDFLDADYEEL